MLAVFNVGAIKPAPLAFFGCCAACCLEVKVIGFNTVGLRSKNKIQGRGMCCSHMNGNSEIHLIRSNYTIRGSYEFITICF